MQIPRVRTVTRAQREGCIDVIVQAFRNDPVARWVYPDEHQYFRSFPQFVALFGGKAFEWDSAHCVEDQPAAALWLPPGVHPDEEALMALIEESVSAERRLAVAEMMEQMDAHHPAEPHWHLPLIATEPGSQGAGYGSALLRYGLTIADEQQKPAYLEATTERNMALYQRHGFEVAGRIQAGGSPPVTPMLRVPR
jgi:ribosomal protein S18 acetylase RimI-like enzyme